MYKLKIAQIIVLLILISAYTLACSHSVDKELDDGAFQIVIEEASEQQIEQRDEFYNEVVKHLLDEQDMTKITISYSNAFSDDEDCYIKILVYGNMDSPKLIEDKIIEKLGSPISVNVKQNVNYLNSTRYTTRLHKVDMDGNRLIFIEERSYDSFGKFTNIIFVDNNKVKEITNEIDKEMSLENLVIGDRYLVLTALNRAWDIESARIRKIKEESQE